MFNQIPYLWCYVNPVPSLKGLIQDRLRYLGYTIQEGDDWFYAPGELPVLLVAHMDTVHARVPSKKEVKKQKGRIHAPSVGLGADDRAGVAGIMEILFRGHRPHVLFTDKEEVGCVGAGKAALALDPPDVRYVIELDRAGSKDCVFYDCANEDFEAYVEGFGFQTQGGSFTDISKLCPAWGIAGVNLSIGYYHQHTKQEYLVLEEWKQTVDRVCRMLKDIPAEPFEYVERYQWCDDYFDMAYYDGYNYGKQETGVGIYWDVELLRDSFGGTRKEWSDFVKDYGKEIERRLDDYLYDMIQEMYLRYEQNRAQ